MSRLSLVATINPVTRPGFEEEHPCHETVASRLSLPGSELKQNPNRHCVVDLRRVNERSTRFRLTRFGLDSGESRGRQSQTARTDGQKFIRFRFCTNESLIYICLSILIFRCNGGKNETGSLHRVFLLQHPRLLFSGSLGVGAQRILEGVEQRTEHQ